MYSYALYHYITLQHEIIQTPWQFIILFLCMGACITHLGIQAIEAVALDPKSPIFIDPRSDRWMGVGYYGNSNEFGQLMITTIPFLYALIFIRKNIILTSIAIAMFIPMIYVMVKCESRTVMITFALMTVTSIMLRGGGSIIKKAVIGGILSLFVLVGLSFAPGPIQDRLNTVTDASNDESFQGRTRSWGAWRRHANLAPVYRCR